MVGIVSKPARPLSLGVVIVVGGPQYRAGSHRQFLLLARSLADAGFAVLRFDCRGMGDSEGEPRSFEALDDDIAAAVNALQKACPQVQRVALWGLCDGASAALLYVGRSADARIAGLCLLNPWVRSDLTSARTRIKHYYGERFLQVEFWRKMFKGELEWRQSVASLWANWRASRQKQPPAIAGLVPFQEEMAAALRRYPGVVLLILSGNDHTAKEFIECASSDAHWAGLLQGARLERLDVEGADHTFSSTQWRAQVEQATLKWLVAFRQTP
jgi:exosortase A-associated hydrolase 1